MVWVGLENGTFEPWQLARPSKENIRTARDFRVAVECSIYNAGGKSVMLESPQNYRNFYGTLPSFVAIITY